ncbi:hypothetical protein C7N43_29185 [Sphingobacteriales bacterium UPWRP_1]|nr:hypothetical protein BVG80_18330 [Sphingobacteriales bacterium TSM_CSM]PSJ73429.1 hypothetical protein C7N43_29185 [Sphingobacteriales bacterium UPWRP_1]
MEQFGNPLRVDFFVFLILFHFGAGNCRCQQCFKYITNKCIWLPVAKPLRHWHTRHRNRPQHPVPVSSMPDPAGNKPFGITL